VLRFAPLAAVALLLLPAAAGARTSGGTIVAYIVSPPSLLFVASGHELVATVSVEPVPTAVAAAVDGRVVLVVSPVAGALTVVDGRTRAVLAVIRGFRRPTDVALAPRRRFAFVADAGSRRLAVVDLVHWRIASWLALQAAPLHLALHDSELWVTFGRRSRAPEVIDVTHPSRPASVGRVHLAGAVREVAFGADGLHAYATFWGPRLTRLWSLSFQRSAVGQRQLAAPVAAIAVDVLGQVWTAHGSRLSMRSPRSLAVERTLQLRAPIRALVAAGGFVLALTGEGLTSIDIVRAKPVATTLLPNATALAYRVL
jgi:hypothetical protein